jgi:hypothetical protein
VACAGLKSSGEPAWLQRCTIGSPQAGACQCTELVAVAIRLCSRGAALQGGAQNGFTKLQMLAMNPTAGGLKRRAHLDPVAVVRSVVVLGAGQQGGQQGASVRPRKRAGIPACRRRETVKLWHGGPNAVVFITTACWLWLMQRCSDAVRRPTRWRCQGQAAASPSKRTRTMPRAGS